MASTAYNGSGQLASLGVGGTPASPLYSEAFGYDGDLRLNAESATTTGAGSAFYSLALGFDAGGNLTSASTTLPAAGTKAGGSEQQSFCYDAFNRLVWAGTAGTPTGPADGTCGPVPSADTLTGASYTATFAYDNLGRITSGPAGASYTYSDPAHLHAVTATTDGHSYAYDAAGNVSCRATAAGGCSGPSPTGAPYTYDNEGRLASWANKPSGATVTATELYDGRGERVARQTTSSGVLTSSVYVGALAEYDTTGSTTTTTDYFAFAGQTIAIYDTNYHYLVADQVGTPVVQLNASGTPELVALKLPYGSGRYAAASLANLGFTGQRKDTSPNLTYFNARFYDQDVGVFLSPDNMRPGTKPSANQTQEGPNPYGYVGGRVESATDPSGHRQCFDACAGESGNGGSSGTAGSKPQPNLPNLLSSIFAKGLTLATYYAIVTTFHNPITQLVLFALAQTATGMKFLPFFLEAGSRFGDAYITWHSGGSAGYTDGFGFIQLSTDLFKANNGGVAGVVTAANALIHEGVESYFALAWGVRTQASQHLDYVAQKYADDALDQLNKRFHVDIAHDRANHESFLSWLSDPYYAPGGAYSGEPREQWDPWSVAAVLLTVQPGQWIDTMGISPGELIPEQELIA